MVYVCESDCAIIRIYNQLLSDANAATARIVAGVFCIRVERPILLKLWKSKAAFVPLLPLLASATRCVLVLFVSAQTSVIVVLPWVLSHLLNERLCDVVRRQRRN